MASSGKPRARHRSERLRREEFCNSVERLAWARSSGCPWNELTCARVAEEGHLGGAGVGAGTRLPVERVDVCTCRLGRAPGGVEVGARLPMGRPLVQHWCGVLGLFSVKLFTYNYLMPVSVRVVPIEPME